MKKLIFYTLLCLVGAYFSVETLNAQLSDFRLSDFKRPDYKRQGIDLNFGFEGHSWKIDVDNYPENKSFNFNETVGGEYFYNRNTRNYVGSRYFGISTNDAFRKTDYDSTLSKSNGFNGRLYFSTNNTFFTPQQYFISISLAGSMFNSSNNSKYINSGSIGYTDKTRSVYNEYNLNSLLGFGKGRQEPIEDARQAIYILEQLKNVKKLKHEPTNEEIMQLANRISELKNERILDSRLHKIKELTVLDSLLQKLDLIDNPDIAYFSNLNDMWAFGNLPQRTSGYQIGIYYNPKFEYTNIHDVTNTRLLDQDTTTNHKQFTNGISLKAAWSKPIKQKFQSDLTYHLDYNFYKDKNQPAITYSDQFIISTLNYSFAYYPNTRTSIYIGLSIINSKTLYNTLYENGGENNLNSVENIISPNFNIDYYFSPKLQVNCSFAATKEWFKYTPPINKSNSFMSNITISMKYSIF